MNLAPFHRPDRVRAVRRGPLTLALVAFAACGPGTEGTDHDGAADADARAAAPDADAQRAIDAPTTGTDGALDAAPDAGAARDVATPDDARPDASGADVVVPPAPSDPALRTAAQICPRWNSDVAASTGVPAWTAGATRCAAGTLAPATSAAAVRLTNTYRWLAGLAPVVDAPSHDAAAQACAVLEQANGMLDHTPPMSWTCWTATGYDGTSHSNIADVTGTIETPMDAVSGWVDDSFDITMTLGHRRWMLWPQLGPISYGETSNYACLYVLGATGTGSKPWVAWPNEGPTPMESMSNIWSFSSGSEGVTASATVAVTRDGAAVTTHAMLRTNGYGDPTVSWMMSGITAGATYHVTVAGLTSHHTIAYDVRPVTCAGM